MEKTGVVVKAISSFFYVNVEGAVFECKASTKLKRNKMSIITGDYVSFESETNYITKLLPRETVLIRPKIANVSNAMLIFSAIEPNMNYGMLDRMILIMELNGVSSTIVITKMDLLSDAAQKSFKETMVYYIAIGYKVLYSDADYEAIQNYLTKDKYVFTGQTGVGKSTLINRLIPELNLKTQPISKALGRGKHSTREVTFYNYNNSFIIDTPGFSAIDIDFTKEMIRDNYIDFVELSVSCRFNTCYHLKEPNCNVKRQVGTNAGYDRRYNNYVKIMDDLGVK